MLSSVYELMVWMSASAPIPPGGSEPSPPPTGGSSPTIVVNPTAVGAPGRQTIQDLLDWLAQYSLWACVAAMIAGGGLFAWARRTGGHNMAVTGTALAGGGAVGTILVGLAPQIVTTLYQHT